MYSFLPSIGVNLNLILSNFVDILSYIFFAIAYCFHNKSITDKLINAEVGLQFNKFETLIIYTV